MQAVGAHRDPRVAHSDQAGLDADLVAGQPRGVAPAVVALVVLADGLGHVAQAGGKSEYVRADVRVAANHLPLLGSERAGLGQDARGHRELADVVEARGRAGAPALPRVEAQLVRDQPGPASGLAAVVDGAIAQVDVVHERLHEVQDAAALHQPFDAALVSVRADLDPVATHRLGRVERSVGEAQQLGQRRGVSRHRGAADGRGHDHRMLFADIEWLLGDALAKALGDRHEGGSLHVVEDHEELLAAVAGDHVAGPPGPGEALGRLAQNLVAHRMAVRVVDLLEVVEVEDHHPRLEPRVLAALPLAVAQMPVGVAPIEQAGELVGVRDALLLAQRDLELRRRSAGARSR